MGDPGLTVVRTATQDVELGGVHVPAGAFVAVSLGAANRDPQRYAEPDAFDIFRADKQHISFGDGAHRCLGMHLARLEMRVLLNAVLDRLPGLRLDPAVDDVHIHGLIFRSPPNLPVRFDLPPDQYPHSEPRSISTRRRPVPRKSSTRRPARDRRADRTAVRALQRHEPARMIRSGHGRPAGPSAGALPARRAGQPQLGQALEGAVRRPPGQAVQAARQPGKCRGQSRPAELCG